MFLLKLIKKFLVREEGRQRERERKKHWLVVFHMCPHWGSNLQPFVEQDNAPTNSHAGKGQVDLFYPY